MKEPLKLYLIEQDENCDYECWTDAVVCAASEDAARRMHPGGMTRKEWKERAGSPGYGANRSRWASSPEKVKVTHLGMATETLEAGVICASNVGA